MHKIQMNVACTCGPCLFENEQFDDRAATQPSPLSVAKAINSPSPQALSPQFAYI